MNSPRGKILVIRGGAIGDFILTLPAIAALRRQFPSAHLEVLGYPHIVQLAMAGGLVDRVQSIEARALAGFFARNGVLDEDLSDYFSEFDIIVSYLFDPDEIFKTNVLRCSLAQFIVGPHRPNEREKLHATKVYLKPLERLAIFDADHLPWLEINVQPDSGRDSALHCPRTPQSGACTVALHPGSGSEKKNWPEKNWAGLLRRLIETTQFNLLLVGGEAEGDMLQRLAAALLAGAGPVIPCGPSGVSDASPGAHGVTRPTNAMTSVASRIQIAQSLPLVELAGLLQTCAAFIGHDSGISHLAAALGLPGIVLWGDTTEEIWRPPHEKISVLKKNGGVKQIAVDETISELRRLLEI